jgi:hypothetical protein
MAMNASTVKSGDEEIDLGNVEMDLVDHRREVLFFRRVAGVTAAAVPRDLFQAIDLAMTDLFQQRVKPEIDIADLFYMTRHASLGELVSNSDSGESGQAEQASHPENADPILHNNPSPYSAPGSTREDRSTGARIRIDSRRNVDVG